MDSNSDEQTELLRNIWNQMKDMDRNLGGRIDRVAEELVATKQELGGRIDGVAAEVAGVKQEVAGVKQEVAGVKQELAAVKRDLGARIDHLTNRVEAADKRLEIRIGDVSDLKAVRVASQVTVELLLKNDARQEEEVALIRERIARIEQHVGLPAQLR